MPECGIFISHLGLGDLIMLIPAMIDCSKHVNKLYVFCKDIYASAISGLLEGCSCTNSIELLQINPAESEPEQVYSHVQTILAKSPDTYIFPSGGYHSSMHPVIDFPTNFYKDLGIDYSTAKASYKVPITARSRELYKLAKCITQKYIFIHTTASNARVDISPYIDISSATIFYINPEENMYPVGHMFHKAASKFIRTAENINMIDYAQVIQNAAQLYMIDSSYFCFASLLQLVPSCPKTVFVRNNNDYATIASVDGWVQRAV